MKQMTGRFTKMCFFYSVERFNTSVFMPSDARIPVIAEDLPLQL